MPDRRAEAEQMARASSDKAVRTKRASFRRFMSLPRSLSELAAGRAGSSSLRMSPEDDARSSRPTCLPRVPSRSRKPSSGSDSTQDAEVLKRPCRLRVNIISGKNLKKRARDPDVKSMIVNVKVEQRAKLSKEVLKRVECSLRSCCTLVSKQRCALAVIRCVLCREPTAAASQYKQLRLGDTEEDGTVPVNQSFTFDIKDPAAAVLTVKLITRTRFGGEKLIGICSDILVSNLLVDTKEGPQEKAKWYDLLSRHGRKLMPGKLLMDIVAGMAEPEHRISLYLGTWNVGNARPPKDLTHWLPTDSRHELIVVGAQECEYQPRQPFNECGKDWINTIKSCVGSRYKVLCSTSRSQLRIAALVRDDAEKAISEIDTGSEATGVGHVMANKGAVGISFKFWDTDLCFINSHFAAHAGYCDVRNSNYREIAENLSVGYQGMALLSKFHHIFWMGDLNYRLDIGSPEDKSPQKVVWQEVVEKINAGQYGELLQHDELRKEMAASRAFHGFNEGLIYFAPTFKVLREQSLSYMDKRLPAWCDRILWKSLDGCNADLISYSSSPDVNTSDHKPVYATMSLTAFALPCNRFDVEDRRWHVEFASLEACNLLAADMNGFSDPYVNFIGPNLISPFQSRVKYRTLNPVWDPLKDLPRVVLSTASLLRLEREYLMCHVLDYDYTSANDTLGYGAIPLGSLVAAFKRNPGEAVAFSIDLQHRGLPAGCLRGSMKLAWERSLLKHKSADSFFIRTLTLRKTLKKAVTTRHHF